MKLRIGDVGCGAVCLDIGGFSRSRMPVDNVLDGPPAAMAIIVDCPMLACGGGSAGVILNCLLF